MDKENLNGIPEEELEETAEQAEEVTETVDDAAENAAEDTAEEETVAEVEEETSTEETADEEPQEEISSDEEPQVEAENAEEICEEVSAEDAEDVLICSACGENEVAEGSNYCIECETKMLKRKIPLLAWLAGLWALGFSVFALVLVALSSAPALQVIKGDICAKDKRWYAAYTEYSQVSAVAGEINSILGMESEYTRIGMGVNKRIIDTIANYTSPIDAYYAAQNLMGDNLDVPFMKEYARIYNEHYDSYMAMGEILDKTFAEDADAEAIFAELDALRGTEGMTDLYIDFYKFAVAAELGVDADGQVELLKALEASCKATGDDYGWLYYQPLADTLCDAGRGEEAIEYLDKIIDADASKYDAYSLKTDILLKAGDVDTAHDTVEEFKSNNEGMDSAYLLEIVFLRRTGEIEKAKALCTEAMQEYESVPELGRQSALLSLLEGDYLSAFNTMMNAYNNAYYMYYYTQDASTLDDPKFYGAVYLTAKLLSESEQMTDDIAEDVEGALSSFEAGTLPDNVEAIVNGEKTIEQVLTEGECDLA